MMTATSSVSTNRQGNKVCSWRGAEVLIPNGFPSIRFQGGSGAPVRFTPHILYGAADEIRTRKHPAWKASALPIELLPRKYGMVYNATNRDDSFNGIRFTSSAYPHPYSRAHCSMNITQSVILPRTSAMSPERASRCALV